MQGGLSVITSPAMRKQSSVENTIYPISPTKSPRKATRSGASLGTRSTINVKFLKNPLIRLLVYSQQTIEDGRVCCTKYMSKKIYSYVKDYVFFKRFFSTFKDQDQMYQLCSKMTVEGFRAGQVIFKQGDDSNDMLYVCLAGRVGVYILNRMTMDEQSQFGRKVNEVGEGEGFGEKALLADSVKLAQRSATCISVVESVLLILDRASFLEAIQEYKQETRQKMKFLIEVIPNFDRIAGLQTSENLMYSFKDDIVQQGTILTSENMAGLNLYFLINGEVQLTKVQNGINLRVAVLNELSKQIVGDELLYQLLEQNIEDPKYEYTCTVVSQEAKILKIGVKILASRAAQECLDSILDVYLKKEVHHKTLLNRRLQLRELNRQSQLKNIHEENKLELWKLKPRRNFIRQHEPTLSPSEAMQTTFLNNVQASDNLLRLKMQVIRSILHLPKKQEIQNEKYFCQRYVPQARQTSQYQNDATVRQLIENQFDNLGDNDLEQLKSYLTNNGYLNAKQISLKQRFQQKQSTKFIDLSKISQMIPLKDQSLDINNPFTFGSGTEEAEKANNCRLISQGYRIPSPLQYNSIVPDPKLSNLLKSFGQTHKRFSKRGRWIKPRVQRPSEPLLKRQGTLELLHPEEGNTERLRTTYNVFSDTMSSPTQNKSKSDHPILIQSLSSVQMATSPKSSITSSLLIKHEISSKPTAKPFEKLSFTHKQHQSIFQSPKYPPKPTMNYSMFPLQIQLTPSSKA